MVTSTPKTPNADDTRFVPNKVERAWFVNTLTAYGAPLQKLKTLENTCAKIAQEACSRSVTDAEIGRDKTLHGISWRREYMSSGTKKQNVVYINSTVLKLEKTVPVAGPDPDDPSGPMRAAVREGGVENDAQHLLDQAVLDYKHASGSRIQTTEESAGQTMQRQKESRREKRQRLEMQKEAYAERKKQKTSAKEAKQRERRATDIQNLKAQMMSANAAVANVAIQRKQCEQFGLFLDMYARKNNLQLPQTTSQLPQSLPCETLEINPELLKEQTAEGTLSSNPPNSSAVASSSPSQNDVHNAISASEVGESQIVEEDIVAPQGPTPS